MIYTFDLVHYQAGSLSGSNFIFRKVGQVKTLIKNFKSNTYDSLIIISINPDIFNEYFWLTASQLLNLSSMISSELIWEQKG